MHLFEWALDARKTTGGKILAIILSLTLVFSLSTWSANAFAEEQTETPTEEAVETEAVQPAVVESASVQEDAIMVASEETPEPDGSQISTAAEGEDENSSNTEQSDGSTTESDTNEESAEPSATWDAETCALTISHLDILNNNVAQSFLKELGISSSSVKILNIIDVDTISSAAFRYVWSSWGSIEKINIKDVNLIGAAAFGDSKSYLKSVSVSLENIGTVGAEAFLQCNALSSLTMKNIQTFERSAFSYCYGLKSLDLDGERDNIGPLSTTMFYDCTGLETVSVKNVGIGLQAFNGCTGLKTVTFDGVDEIGSNVFIRCDGPDTLIVKNVDSIPESAFASAGMKSVEVENVKTIGKKAFSSCKSLECARISNVGTVGQDAFNSCTGLVSVKIDNVKAIANKAFWYCTNLTTVDSLANVTDSIGGFAFFGCEKLTGLTVNDLAKMGFIGSNDEIMERVKAILAGKFQLDNAEEIKELILEEGWENGQVGKSANWQAYDNGTQIMEQARWADQEAGVAEVKVDAYYTGEKQMDYIFVADLSASMAHLGNAADANARFYDMQSKLLDMTNKLLDTPGYNSRVAIVSFGGEFNGNATATNSGFLTNKDDAAACINGLEPLNENTDYGLGLQEALELAQQNSDRNTVVVFLSDGAPTANSSGDQNGTTTASAIKALNVPIYGVLHSPSTNKADKYMADVCDEVYKSTDTESFGEAMNEAFTAVYGNNTVTIPVNAVDFDLANLRVSGGSVSYENGVITWELNGMPFTQHTLTYDLTLNDENANRVGTYSYNLNNGDARIGENGATVGLTLTLSRTVADPEGPTTPDPEQPNVPEQPETPTTPQQPTDPTPDNPGGTEGGTTAPATPAGGATTTTPAADGAAPAGGAADADAGVVIPDDDNPLAGPDDATIEDDENPLAAFDGPQCWTHIWMIVGIVLTVLYGAAVIARRLGYARKIDKIDHNMTGASRDVRSATQTQSATYHA